MSQSPSPPPPAPPAPAPSTPFAYVRDLFTPAGPPEPLLGQSSRPFVRWLPYAVAGVFLAVLLPVTATLLPRSYGMNGGLAMLLSVAQTVPLLIAVTRPLLAWKIAFAADTVCVLALPTPGPGGPTVWPWPAPLIIGMLVLMLAVGLRERFRTSVAVWGLTTVTGYLFESTSSHHGNGSWLVPVILGGMLLLVGGALRGRGDARRALAEQETISEAERARRTLLEERARIARELHDVVAHHMSVITVQADSAPYRLPGLPAEAREEFGSIAATARESLTEMRRLLGVLRSEDTHGERAPQPGLDRLQQLAEATVRAGVPVELTLPELPELPPSVDLSAYRIVQEALANVVRHAPGATVRVSVSLDEDATHLMVLVVNAAPPAAPGPPLETTGTGHGLVGMRERVRLVGGTLDTGPLLGGFRVAARLPLTPLEKEPPTA
ncbi:two-component sensor histidine kinase [Streptomyces mashuensis]|uniref:histidine kinase n=1 Tax=Streptomyces mashuensis TaxID=33904 RepID=A0A919EE75_9ACTN|nr:sensor histidine kinase [Streptomyces mashuensis]GHF54491.1 two-component sensor histidine kinase [Streptomyces mashuensis]